MLYYILIFAAAIGTAVNFTLTKVYQLDCGNTLKSGAVFNCLVGLTGSLIYFAVCGFKIDITPFSLILAIMFTVFVGVYTVIGFKIMSLGSMAVYTVFLMLGGMILPYFYGIIFLNESITVTKVIALLIMIAAIIMQNGTDGKKGKTLFYILCICVFVLNGLTSIVSKMHQTDYGYRTVSENQFVLIKNIIRFLMFGAIIPFTGKDGKSAFAMKPKMYAVITVASVITSTAYLLQLICASHLPATVQFPVMTGGTIIFTALFSFVCFKEKLSKMQILSLILCLTATVFFVI